MSIDTSRGVFRRHRHRGTSYGVVERLKEGSAALLSVHRYLPACFRRRRRRRHHWRAWRESTDGLGDTESDEEEQEEMDLLRKMSSGLRSSQDLTASAEQTKEDELPVEKWAESSDRHEDDDQDEHDGEEEEEEEEEGVDVDEEEASNDLLLHDAEQDDGDVFEDAAAALGQQQRQQQLDEEEGEEQVSNRDDEAAAPEGVSSIHARQPDSVDKEGQEELDRDDGDGEREDDDEDGRASHGSGESFDSALERMAASSEGGDAGSSPKMTSPVGSLQGPVLIGNPPSVLSPSQQGALIRLNEMITGDSSLDTSVIDNSTREEFKSRVTRLAHSRGQSEEDLSFVSIVDALLPLVPEKAEEIPSEEQQGAEPESERPKSRMPKVKLFAEGELDNDETKGSEEKLVEGSALENGHGGADKVKAENGEEKEVSQLQIQPQTTQEEVPQSLDVEQAPESVVNSVPDANGVHKDGLGEAETRAMPMAKLSPESEDGNEQGDEDGGEPLEENTEEVDTQDELPSKVSSIPSDLDEILNPEPKEIVENVERSLPTESTGIQDSSEGRDETPTATTLDHPDEKSASEVPEFDSNGLGIAKNLSNGEGKNEASVVNLDEDDDDDEEDGEENEEDEDDDDDDENEDDEDSIMERSAALAALVRGADSAAGEAPTMGSAGPSLPARPTRTVRSSLPSLDPAPRAAQQPRSTRAAPIQSSNSAEENTADGNEETREKLQSIRVKFLRLALRLGQSPHNVVVAQVLYRLGLAEQLRGGRSNSRNAAFSFDRASTIAEEQERAGPEELDFACTIMMLGKTGVGKSATINSIFDEAKTGTNAFTPSTSKVQVITGHVHGIKVRVIDTPGLLPSVVDQRHNEKIMASVKGFIKKQSPDIVLYFDRLDMQSRDYGDLPLLRTITDTFGTAVWFNAIVVLTHASSAPPDGPNGLPLSYEMFVAQRSHVVQQTIRQAAGDMRLMNPVSLVENHTACRVNRAGDRVLPNGQVWKPQLLLLCFASKILAEANSLLKLQDNTPGKPFGQRSRVPPLPFLLSSLLQSRAQLKLPDEQVGDEDESDEDLEEDDDSDDEEDYDQLPPFRRLAKEEVAELDEVNRAEYFEELAERERLFQKKQWKEELKRRREMKKRMAEASADQPQFGDDGLEEETRSAAVPVPMPDMVLPPSFDSDNPSHRYRYLETANQWLVRPVLETHGWDHDNGYDGMSVEKMFVVGEKVPISVSGQITKDKKEANLNMECAASIKHGEGKVTLAGLDLQTVGKDLAYTLRSETRFSNFKGNKTTGGLALTLLGDTVSAGMKIEDRLLVGKRVKLVVNGGAITGGGDVAYGGSLEATLRDKEYPLSRTLSTLGVSVMDWHGDLAVGGNLQSQFILGKTMMVGRANLNNRGAGQISIRASSSEQLQMTLIGILPIVRAIVNRLFGQAQQ